MKNMSTVAHFSLKHYEHMVACGAFEGPFQKRVELIQGEIVEMSPINIAHANCVTLLAEWGHDIVPRDRIMVRSQNPIRIAMSDSDPDPDVVWVERKEYSEHPEPADVLLLGEVADTSLDFDRTIKREIYAEAGIADYWIVNLLDKVIEVHREPAGKTYRRKTIHRADEPIRPLALPEATLIPSRLFGRNG